MPWSRIVGGAAAGVMVTAPLMALFYLANKLLELPFPPYDLFDWITRVLPGPLVTFGLDLFIDGMILVGLDVADTAKTAELGIALLQFFGMGVALITLVAIVAPILTLDLRRVALVTGIIIGLGLASISLAIGGSTLPALVSIVWIMGVYAAWGYAAGVVLEGVLPRTMEEPLPSPMVANLDMPVEPTAPEDVPEDMERASEPPPVVHTRQYQDASAQPTWGIDGGLNRREFIVRVGGAAAVITVAGTVTGNLIGRAGSGGSTVTMPEGVDEELMAGGVTSFPNDGDLVMPAPGTRTEYTAVEDHYRIFIRTTPTVIDGASWALPISGLVANPVELSIDDIRDNYEPRSQFITLSCISNRVGGPLISTTQWTGASFKDILADVQPLPGARYVNIESGDGFHEIVDLELIDQDERIMLAYAWDERPIPVEHGFPLRIWLPDRYGMKQPKWITKMTVQEEYTEGYWVSRNWDEVARVRATSVVDTISDQAVFEREGQTLVPVGGIAYAGARGISRVEVSVDSGAWQEAQLREPLSDTTWVIWRYDWPFEAGNHSMRVRCYEADGTPQIEAQMGNRPSGATGIHRRAKFVQERGA